MYGGSKIVYVGVIDLISKFTIYMIITLENNNKQIIFFTILFVIKLNDFISISLFSFTQIMHTIFSNLTYFNNVVHHLVRFKFVYLWHYKILHLLR